MNAKRSASTATTRPARADLHVHSRHSDRPSEWFLRRVGAPESFMAPQAVFDACKAAGMDFVTITDHNELAGALEIAHLPGTFLSSELTTYFPENGCKVHVLVHGVTEAQFDILQEARIDIRTLRDVLVSGGICHSVAHPLFRVNDRMTPEQFEELLVLFNRFEGLNGSRDPRAGDILRAVLSGLDAAVLADLATRHGVAPHGARPWVKALTGGSDDHGGLFVAGAFTETPPAGSVEEFLGHLRAGRCQPAGQGGGSVQLASSLYRIAYSFYRERFLGPGQRDATVLGAMLRRLGGEPATARPAAKEGGLRSYVRRLVANAVRRHKQRRLHGIEKLLAEEVQSVLRPAAGMPVALAGVGADDRLQTTFRIVQRLSHCFLARGLEDLSGGRILEGLQSLSSLAVVGLGVAPYLTATGSQHKDASFLEAVARRHPSAARLQSRPGGMAWITDTLTDVNGVSHTIATLAGMAKRSGRKVTVVASPRVPVADVAYDLAQFAPLGTFRLPEYESIELSFPPFLEVLRFLEERQFSSLLVSTPGPLGLCALAATQLLGLPVRGIYHTDFPAMADGATDDPKVGEAARSYMRWFYGRMERVYAPTQSYVDRLVELGLQPDRLAVLPRGVDLDRFSPRHAERSYWSALELDSARFKFLYVGRISRDKNVEALLKAHRYLSAEGGDADLVVVGDGPQRSGLQERYGGPHVVFAGTLRGSALSRAYASADALVFPSRTDTFGNVVLEAHASGLPVVVSDQGGPQEIVSSHGSGLIADTRDPRLLCEAMRRLRADAQLRQSLRDAALRKAAASSWESVLALL